jgi:hypothetical protein
MSIELRDSGFHEWHDYVKGVPGLGIDSKRIDDCVAYYDEHGFGGLFGNPTFGFDQDNLDFLARTTDVKWLWFSIILNSRSHWSTECSWSETVNNVTLVLSGDDPGLTTLKSLNGKAIS